MATRIAVLDDEATLSPDRLEWESLNQELANHLNALLECPSYMPGGSSPNPERDIATLMVSSYPPGIAKVLEVDEIPDDDPPGTVY